MCLFKILSLFKNKVLGDIFEFVWGQWQKVHGSPAKQYNRLQKNFTKIENISIYKRTIMEASESNLGKLTEESYKRKERLRHLREIATKHVLNKDSKKSIDLPKPIFRSYKPQNESTVGDVLPQEPSGDIESAVEDQLDLLKQPIIIDEIDITNLAPRKPDWDLKRDVSKKLDRLERRTQKAIAELIRERLKKNQELNSIFQAVNIGTAFGAETTNTEAD